MQTIERKEKELKIFQENELKRMIREFDYKNYDKKFNIDPSTVLSSLFGSEKAEKEIIRNGLQKKFI